MIPKSTKRRTNQVLNQLHKGFVLTCVGVTVVGTTYLGARFYHYMTVTRPQYLELQKQQLLGEGSSDNATDLSAA